MTGIFIPDPSAVDIEALTRFQRESATAAMASRLLEVYYATDIRQMLPAIRARTAILHREGDMTTSFKLGQEVAVLIPGAALFPLSGSSHPIYYGDWAAVADTRLGFLCAPAGAQAPLAARELEVAGLVADGLTSHSIALRLSIATRTAEAHVENIRRKLQMHSCAQIARWVTEHRLRTQRLGSSPDARRGPDRPGLGQPAGSPYFTRLRRGADRS